MSDLSDLSDLSDKMGAPVFALTGYAVASHVIPRGLRCRCLVWRRGADVLVGYACLFDGNGGMRGGGGVAQQNGN